MRKLLRRFWMKSRKDNFRMGILAKNRLKKINRISTSIFLKNSRIHLQIMTLYTMTKMKAALRLEICNKTIRDKSIYTNFMAKSSLMPN